MAVTNGASFYVIALTHYLPFYLNGQQVWSELSNKHKAAEYFNRSGRYGLIKRFKSCLLQLFKLTMSTTGYTAKG